MKQLILLLILVAIPGAALALEQSFTQQGTKVTIRLSPEKLESESKVQLSLGLSKDGVYLTDRDVSLEVYEKNADQPIIKRPVDVLDTEYVDSWKFEKAGDYRVAIKITDHRKPDEIISYEVNASVVAGGGHGDQGLISHHFGGGRWGWWGTGLMLIMVVPMVVLML